MTGAVVFGAAAVDSSDFRNADLSITRPTEQTMQVRMTLIPNEFNIKYNQDVTITPVIRQENGEVYKDLPSLTFAGRNAYYYDIRDGQQGVYKRGSKEPVNYVQEFAYEPWMEHSRLEFRCTTGCCGKQKIQDVAMATMDYVAPEFIPTYTYVRPTAEGSKLFDIHGQAFINFPVNKTVIYPEYMTNPTELKKILNSIDAVRDNKDATVKHIGLTGYASPEGPYENNVRLAKGRTEALREYIRSQYNFPGNIFTTNSVPEDWEGLKAAVEKTALPDRDAILKFIDSGYPIEKRNDELRRLFPESYAYLLREVYPGLRHTDYVVNYEVRKYTDVNEIRRILKTRPQNLSLNEFFLCAQSYKPGTPEFDEVFDVAVRMYPDNPVANLNAGLSAISRGDLKSAETFLKRAGNSPDADYARGILAGKQGDYDKALTLLNKAGTPAAMQAAADIEKIQNYTGGVTYLNK